MFLKVKKVKSSFLRKNPQFRGRFKMPFKRVDKDEALSNLEDVEERANSIFEKVFGDISKTSVTKQILLGASTGWVTGYLAMRVGKSVALALGGGIILLEIANEKGYVKINWSKITEKVDKVSDIVDEKISGQRPGIMDKVERYVDRQIDKAGNTIQKKQKGAKSWYRKVMGDSEGQLKEVHIFLVSFVAGVAIGIGTA